MLKRGYGILHAIFQFSLYIHRNDPRRFWIVVLLGVISRIGLIALFVISLRIFIIVAKGQSKVAIPGTSQILEIADPMIFTAIAALAIFVGYASMAICDILASKILARTTNELSIKISKSFPLRIEKSSFKYSMSSLPKHTRNIITFSQLLIVMIVLLFIILIIDWRITIFIMPLAIVAISTNVYLSRRALMIKNDYNISLAAFTTAASDGDYSRATELLDAKYQNDLVQPRRNSVGLASMGAMIAVFLLYLYFFRSDDTDLTLMVLLIFAVRYFLVYLRTASNSLSILTELREMPKPLQLFFGIRFLN
ncbi:MAG: hypothetical protein ACRBCJ_12490 [Hyphomicrobiaceae bacterium]